MSPRAEMRRGSNPWTGNTTATTDDADGFYDRSLGTITNGSLATKPYQLTAAQIPTGTRTGTLATAYDPAGNLTTLVVDRNGECTPTAKCSHIYAYEWDELNRLSRAHRWDFTDIPDVTTPPTVTVGTEDADLRYGYDNDDNRVIKTAHDAAAGTDSHTLYIYSSLEERHTSYNAGGSGDYDIGAETEVPYLFANGVRLARVVYNPSAPVSDPSDQHVFLELGDHLGSTSTVLDKVTGELVEKASYQPYGATESDYRPGRWGDFREDYRFTGHEDDVEVGLTYFGKRYLNPLLGRWMSPDPLALHDAGQADLNLYAYVHGRVLEAVDPFGLEDAPATNEHGQTPNDVAAEKAWQASYLGVHAGVGPAAQGAHRQGNSVMQNMLVGAALANLETPDAIKINDPTASSKGIPGGHGPKANGSVWAQVAYLGTTIVGAAISTEKKVVQEGIEVGGKVGAALTSAVREVHDGISLATGEALDAAASHLGSGAKHIAPGVYTSADGTKMVRMTDADLAKVGNHAGAPHMNFVTGQTVTKPNGKESFRIAPGGNAHVFLPEEK